MLKINSKILLLIVTPVTGLLRAFSLPRNSVYAFHINTYRGSVTAVTGFRTRAHAGKISHPLFILFKFQNKFFSREVNTPVTSVTPVTTIDFKDYL